MVEKISVKNVFDQIELCRILHMTLVIQKIFETKGEEFVELIDSLGLHRICKRRDGNLAK